MPCFSPTLNHNFVQYTYALVGQTLSNDNNTYDNK